MILKKQEITFYIYPQQFPDRKKFHSRNFWLQRAECRCAPRVLPVSGWGSTGRAAVCSILLTLQCSLALNSAETTELQTQTQSVSMMSSEHAGRQSSSGSHAQTTWTKRPPPPNSQTANRCDAERSMCEGNSFSERRRTLFLVVVLPGLTVVCHQALRLVLLTYRHKETEVGQRSDSQEVHPLRTAASQR